MLTKTVAVLLASIPFASHALHMSTMTTQEACRKATPFMGTMKGPNKLQGVMHAISQISENKAAGDIVEAGVAEGGGVLPAIFYLACTGDLRGRTVYLFDSWEGIPEAVDPKDAGFEKGKYIKSYDNFTMNVAKFGVSFDFKKSKQQLPAESMTNWEEVWSHVKTVKGFFADTMSVTLENKPLGLLMCDGDMYQSTKDCMNAAAHLVSKGGAVYNDDYYTFKGCYEAVNEYLQDHKSEFGPMQLVPERGDFQLLRESSPLCTPPRDNVQRHKLIEGDTAEGTCDGEIYEGAMMFRE